jgi:ribosomal protein S30
MNLFQRAVFFFTESEAELPSVGLKKREDERTAGMRLEMSYRKAGKERRQTETVEDAKKKAKANPRKIASRSPGF